MMKLILLSALSLVALSVMYSLDSNYKVSLQRSPLELAHCYYVDRARTEGWSQFYVYASEGYDLTTQYRAAGYLEGYSSYKEIYYAYTNFYKSILEGSPNVNIKVKDFVDQQLDWIDYMYKQNSRDQYWQQAYALVEQVRYMYKGFIKRVNQEKATGFNIGFSQFYYLTNTGDLEDIIPAFKEANAKQEQKQGECNAFIKIIKNKLYVTQSTFNIYQFMLRFHKTYHFPATRSFQPAAETISLTSRPGDLESKDDFYLLSSGLAVVETSLSNFRPDNYKLLDPKSVPTWIRHLTANRLARNPTEWANIFLKFRSYTHNNQWLVIDLDRFHRENETEVLMVQEGFAQSAVNNFTSRLHQKGFVASYNVPYDQKVYDALGYQDYGFNYENDPRQEEFAEINGKITSHDLLKSYLLANQNQDPCSGIAPRCDLKPEGAFLFGMIDQKIASSDISSTNSFEAIAGPPTNNGKWKPFDWSVWPGVSHLGMPEVSNFTWMNLPFDYEASDSVNLEGNLKLTEE